MLYLILFNTTDESLVNGHNDEEEEESTGVYIAMNLRRSLDQPLAPKYLGNNLTMIHISMPAWFITLTVDKLSKIALLTSRQIKRIDDTYNACSLQTEDAPPGPFTSRKKLGKHGADVLGDGTI